MNTHSSAIQPAGWFSRAEAWLDDKGKGAWIVAMVLGFIVFWPIGLALLAYMLWSKKMMCSQKWRSSSRRPVTKESSGNSAFDAYRNETIRRLETEQKSFQAFLGRLRDARDKAEFDQFMEERARQASNPEADEDGTGMSPTA